MTRVLVTGAAGFIYSNFVRYALEHRPDWRIVTLDRLDEAGSLERLAALRMANPSRLSCVWHDLKEAINPVHSPELREPFDYIVHGAAMSHVDRAIADPPGAVKDNVLGTSYLLEYVRHHQSRAKCLLVSTDEVFGPAPEGVEFGEHARMEPENAYAAAKAGGELLGPAYAHQYGLSIVTTRCSNAFGPNQYREKFIPLCIERIQEGRVVQIHSRNGVPSSRLYIYVDDVASATLTVLERGGTIQDASSGRYNIVSSSELSNLYVAQTIALLLGKELQYELVENPPGRPKPDQRYAISAEKLKRLGWAPRVTFEDGLRSTLESLVPVPLRCA